MHKKLFRYLNRRQWLIYWSILMKGQDFYGVSAKQAALVQFWPNFKPWYISVFWQNVERGCVFSARPKGSWIIYWWGGGGDIFLCIELLHVHPLSGHIELLKLTHYLWGITKWNDGDLLFMCIRSATDFTLKPSDCPDTEFPVRIADSDRGCLWYRKDNKFKIPKGEMCWSLCVCVCVCVHHLACKLFS